jgi:hypothetical protein
LARKNEGLRGSLASKPNINDARRRFLKQVFAGATAGVVAVAAGIPGRVIAPSGYGAPEAEAGTLQVGRLQVATENFARFTVPERDQIHEMFNNTWADTTSPHQAMIGAQWSPNMFQAWATWSWPAWDKNYTHAWHGISHGTSDGGNVIYDSRYPFPISNHQSLKLDIPNVNVSGDGRWALAIDLFLYKGGTNPTFITANQVSELFIVLKRYQYDVPPESDSLSSLGVNYGYGRWSTTNICHAFWRKDDPAVPFRLQIDIYDFIRFMKAKGFNQDSDILGWVTLGSEPIQGTGMWHIDSLYTTLS